MSKRTQKTSAVSRFSPWPRYTDIFVLEFEIQKKKQRMFLPSLVCVFRNLLSSYYTLDSSRRSSPSQQLPSERETRRGSINQSIESVTREWIQTLSPLTQLFQLRHLRRLLHLNNSTLSQTKICSPQKSLLGNLTLMMQWTLDLNQLSCITAFHSFPPRVPSETLPNLLNVKPNYAPHPANRSTGPNCQTFPNPKTSNFATNKMFQENGSLT